MPSFNATRIVPAAADDLYDIVADLERYPDFLDYVREVRILREGGGTSTVSVSVGLGPIRFPYECEVAFEPKRRIRVAANRKPFRTPAAEWRFTALGPASTRLDYDLRSEFASWTMERTAGLVFARQVRHSLAAFEARLRKA